MMVLGVNIKKLSKTDSEQTFEVLLINSEISRHLPIGLVQL